MYVNPRHLCRRCMLQHNPCCVRCLHETVAAVVHTGKTCVPAADMCDYVRCCMLFPDPCKSVLAAGCLAPSMREQQQPCRMSAWSCCRWEGTPAHTTIQDIQGLESKAERSLMHRFNLAKVLRLFYKACFCNGQYPVCTALALDATSDLSRLHLLCYPCLPLLRT